MSVRSLSLLFLLAVCVMCVSASTFTSVLKSLSNFNALVEAHHSLHAPLDKSTVYWNYGGSTVVTKNLIRLTPATQDRRGWLWNEYPLEQTNWEVEFKTEVFSKPHFGGDGFGFWVLAGEQDPSFTQNPDALTGPLFGLKQDFTGFGVVFDVYDNDNRRNNPSVFVLQQVKGQPISPMNHDNDYENDMVAVKPPSASPETSAHKCVADIRNTGKVTKVLVKFVNRIVHVYIDNSEGLGYKFCLAVQLNDDFKDHHLAFTAATGQVADAHDIIEITTRYLTKNEKFFDDQLVHLGTEGVSHHTTLHSMFWLLTTAVAAASIGVAGYQFQMFQTLVASRIDEVAICAQINPLVLPHYGVHTALTILLLLNGSWIIFLLNLPLTLWRAYEFYKKTFFFSPADIGPAKGHTSSRNIVYIKLVVSFVVYGITFLYSFYRLFW